MSHSRLPVRLIGFADFKSPWGLQVTAAEISEQLFGGIPFSAEVPGLRDEVPAVMLTKEVFGLVLVLYGTWEGDRGFYTLHAETGQAIQNRMTGQYVWLDIGQWLAQLLGTIREFEVVGYSPVEIQPPKS